MSSFFDKAKAKATETVAQNADRIKQGVAKAGQAADQRTGGKYSDKIAKAQGKVTGAVDRTKGEAPSSTDPAAPTHP